MELMSRVALILGLFSFLSLSLSFALVFYSRNIVRRLRTIADEIADLREASGAFATHVKKVYELEMFYGDQTLKALMDHARSFREYMDTFDYIYITDEQGQNEATEEDQSEEEA